MHIRECRKSFLIHILPHELRRLPPELKLLFSLLGNPARRNHVSIRKSFVDSGESYQLTDSPIWKDLTALPGVTVAGKGG
jgi:hypothetical protein